MYRHRGANGLMALVKEGMTMNVRFSAVLLTFLVSLTWVHTASATYSPRQGRFLQSDPAGYVDGENLYQYVMSSPQYYLDPFGTQTSQPGSPTKFAGKTKHGEFQHFQRSIQAGRNGMPPAENQNIIDFIPNESNCCDEISFIQVVYITDPKGNPIDPPDIPKRARERETEDNPETGVGKGRRVDVYSESREAWYGYKNGKPVQPSETGGRSPTTPGQSQKGNQSPAQAFDIPTAPGVKNQNWRAETCAVCKSGQEAGVVYGCINWGYDMDGNGNMTDGPVSVTEKPSASFNAAVDKFNGQSGNTPTGPLK